ncbi:hypothetical protein ARMSODRAFT_1019943 [Armillaria solidipes]|uniref:Uncharacterized protein n=1 Tax=Armillaria solidipes TaxID=1076256 RepID=A0A2H3BHI2_9AGAR|nr:hypothetical protein ARMSODRAFT_1019943 [Armillaria solidipes]
MSYPTRDQDRHWAGRWWHPPSRSSDTVPLPTFQTPLTSSPCHHRHNPKTQPLAPATHPEPPRPLRRPTTETYGLGTNSTCPSPTTLLDYHPWSGPQYLYDPVPSWLSPLRPPSASRYDPPSDAFPPMSPAAQRMISSPHPGGLRPQRPNTLASPWPHSQLEGSRNEPSPSPLMTKMTLMPSPPVTPTPMSWSLSPLDLAKETSHPHPRNLLPSPTDETATPSTSTAPTTSEQNSTTLTDGSSAPIAPKPGSYKDVTSRLASILKATTDDTLSTRSHLDFAIL